jgi:hypothetical protein
MLLRREDLLERRCQLLLRREDLLKRRCQLLLRREDLLEYRCQLLLRREVATAAFSIVVGCERRLDALECSFDTDSVSVGV